VRSQPAELSLWLRIRKAFEPLPSWGPADPHTLKRYKLFMEQANDSSTLRYFVESFYPTLPWSYCREEWGPNCLDSTPQAVSDATQSTVRTTSAEYYFT